MHIFQNSAGVWIDVGSSCCTWIVNKGNQEADIRVSAW